MKTTVIGTDQRSNEMTVASCGPQAPATGVTPGRVVSSEWTKLRSLRSSWWSAIVLVGSILLAGAFAAVGIVVQHTPPAAEAVAADPTGGALSGVGFAQLAAIALGVLAVTGEYRTRMIRGSFAAVPARVPVVWAKAAVVAAVAALISLVAVVLAFGISSAVVSLEEQTLSLTRAGVARSMVGAALVVALTAVLATAFAWLLRSTAGAVSALAGVLYLLPSLAVVLPDAVSSYLPSSAAGAVTQITPAGASLAPWVGLVVYAAYAALALALAAVVVRRRDA